MNWTENEQLGKNHFEKIHPPNKTREKTEKIVKIYVFHYCSVK